MLLTPGTSVFSNLFATLHCTTAPPSMGCRSGLHLAADVLNLSKHSQHVSPENLPNVIRAVSAIEQPLCDLRQVSGGINPLRRSAAHSIEIGAQANVIHARHFGN